jgi:hypothetical protein
VVVIGLEPHLTTRVIVIGHDEYSRQVTVSVTTACSYSDFPCSYSFQLPKASLPPHTAGEGTTGRRCGPRVT